MHAVSSHFSSRGHPATDIPGQVRGSPENFDFQNQHSKLNYSVTLSDPVKQPLFRTPCWLYPNSQSLSRPDQSPLARASSSGGEHSEMRLAMEFSVAFVENGL